MRHPTLLLLASLTLPVFAQQHDPKQHQQHAGHQPPAAATDARQPVGFPAAMKAHTLANMRDHLLALQEIQSALSRLDFDRASDVAEQRLGMSAMKSHGAHDVAKFMPKGMQDAGSAMHRSASRFALAARDAAVTQDLKAPLAGLSEVMAACVACHAGYRFK